MSEWTRVMFTLTSLSLNLLARFDILSYKFHYLTILSYTILDCFTIFQNKRFYSLLLHHIATCRLSYGALENLSSINTSSHFHNIAILELSSLFNSFHKIFKKKITKYIRNFSWITVRLLIFPCITFRVYTDLMNDTFMFDSYSFDLITLLVLSLEWTAEVLQLNISNISSLYFIIPFTTHLINHNYTSLLFAFSIAIFNRISLPKLFPRYETRMIVNAAACKYLQKYTFRKI
jgi:hypothetical protein